MTRLPVEDSIRSLREDGAVRLAGEMLRLAQAAIGPPSTYSTSHVTKAPDKGVDARSYFPLRSATTLPRLRNVWQIKSGSKTPGVAPFRWTGEDCG